MIRRPPRSTLFPYTRSSDLHRTAPAPDRAPPALGGILVPAAGRRFDGGPGLPELLPPGRWISQPPQDRKSTRLNSSHTVISYAVFCLKKKKKTKLSTPQP